MPEEWRQFVIIRMTGWTEQEYDATTGYLCDQIIRLASIEAEAETERAERGR